MNEQTDASGAFVDAQKRVPPEGPAPAGPKPRRDRRHPVHLSPSEKQNRAIIIFVTACSAKRRKVFATAEAHAAIVTAWNEASRWLVGRYVIIPDHVHFFCAPNDLHPSRLRNG